MNSHQFRIRTTSGDFLPINADGMSLHESGAVIFANMDASGNPVPSVVISPHAYQRVESFGPVPAPAPPPSPTNRAARRAKKA